MRPVALFVLSLLIPVIVGPAWAAAPSSDPAYELVWSDEFDGTALDLDKWQPQIGTGCPDLCGWGNEELQYYRAENATVADGFLTITAREERIEESNYTSARLRTRHRGDWTYGRFEIRARMPIGQGMWPAFWMLPPDSRYGSWAASGEIDIVEYLGQEPDTIHGTIHHGGEWPGNTKTGAHFTLPEGDFHSEFHTFAVEWEPEELRWYVNGQLYQTLDEWWSSKGAYPAPFDQRFHLLLNLAVGGRWPGNPDAGTRFPQEFVIDYVRVYQRVE